MSTLADERRRIAEGISSSRAGTGADERRAIGQRLVRERRGIKEDLNALEKAPRRGAQLPALERRGSRAPAMGVGHWSDARLPATGAGGLRSPISEISRTYYPAQIFESSDGLVSFTLRRTRELVMRDADGVEEVRVFSDAD